MKIGLSSQSQDTVHVVATRFVIRECRQLTRWLGFTQNELDYPRRYSSCRGQELPVAARSRAATSRDC